MQTHARAIDVSAKPMYISRAMASDLKDERFQIRMSADERTMLRELGEQAGESEATVVRRLIREAHAKRPEPPRRKRIRL